MTSLEPLRTEVARLREENAAKVGALMRYKNENDSLQYELQKLSQELITASSQLAAYERRLCLLEESALKDREREAELHSARKGLMKNRMMVEGLLMKELSKVAGSGSGGGAAGGEGGGPSWSSSNNDLWPDMTDEILMLGQGGGGGGGGEIGTITATASQADQEARSTESDVPRT